MTSKLVLVIVFLFDLIAFALAVAAEQRRSTVFKVSSFSTLSFSTLFLLNFLYLSPPPPSTTHCQPTRSRERRRRRERSRCRASGRRLCFRSSSSLPVVASVVVELIWISWMFVNRWFGGLYLGFCLLQRRVVMGILLVVLMGCHEEKGGDGSLVP